MTVSTAHLNNEHFLRFNDFMKMKICLYKAKKNTKYLNRFKLSTTASGCQMFICCVEDFDKCATSVANNSCN